MAIGRYDNTLKIAGGRKLATSDAHVRIFNAVKVGEISATTYTTSESERLDTLAAEFLGDARLWWVIAASSGIGWGMQVPPGIELNIPDNMNQVEAYI